MRSTLAALFAFSLLSCTNTPLIVNITVPTSTSPQADMGVVVAAGEPGITVAPTSGLKTTASGQQAQFKVALQTQPTDSVTIGLSSSDITQGTVSPAKLVFTGDNWATAQTVTVTGVDDLIVNGDHLYTIITAPAVSNDPNYEALNAPDVSVTNIETDMPGFVVKPTSGLTTQPAPVNKTATFTVRLGTQPSDTVTFTLASNNSNEGTAAPGTLTFTTANWSMPQTVTVTGVDDKIFEGDTGYLIVSQPATSNDTDYAGLTAPSVSVTNKEVDVVGVTVNPTSGLSTTKAGGTASFTVVLTSEPTAEVDIATVSSDGTKGMVTSATPLKFTTLNYNTPQTVTVKGVNDGKATGPSSYNVALTATSADTHYNGFTIPAEPITSIDTNMPGISVVGGPLSAFEGHTATFTVALATTPTSSVTIPLSTNNGTLNTGSGAFTSGSIIVSTTAAVTVTWTAAANTDVDVSDATIRSGTISFGSSTSSDSNYSGKTPSSISLADNEDDINVWVGYVDATHSDDMTFCSAGANPATCSTGQTFSLLDVGGTVNFIWQKERTRFTVPHLNRLLWCD